MRPKELWEKDIARWKKRRAKAAEKNASGGAVRAGTASTPAPKDTVKSEPVSVGQKPSVSKTAEITLPSRPNLAPPTSLKRNLSAIAEQETQQRADQRKNHHPKSRTEQLAGFHHGANTSGVRGNKENVTNNGRNPPVATTSRQVADPGATSSTLALQPVNANPASYQIPAPLMQQLKEIPEAVLKRYLGQSTLDLLPAAAAVSVDSARSANSQGRSPATSPTEVGSVTHSRDEVIEWGDADLAGLFRFSQSQQAESVGSFATMANHPLEHAMPTSGADVGGHLGSDEFAMDGLDEQQHETYQDGTEFALETDPDGPDLPSRANSMVNSSPSRQPFDFSQLPPSSPPMYDQDEVDHAAALWSSSPETSPVDFGTISVKEVSPLRPQGGAMDDLLQSLERSAQAEALRLINESNL